VRSIKHHTREFCFEVVPNKKAGMVFEADSSVERDRWIKAIINAAYDNKMKDEEDCTTEDWYEALGLQPTCTLSEVKKAYHKLSLKHHPDKGGTVDDFKRITMAYNELTELKEVEQEESAKYDNLQVTLKRESTTVGWGLILGIQGEAPHTRPIVTKMSPNYAAAASGLIEVGDLIGKVDGVTTKGCDRSSMSELCLVNGKTEMTLEMMRLKKDAEPEAPTLTVSIPLASISAVEGKPVVKYKVVVVSDYTEEVVCSCHRRYTEFRKLDIELNTAYKGFLEQSASASQGGEQRVSESDGMSVTSLFGGHSITSVLGRPGVGVQNASGMEKLWNNVVGGQEELDTDSNAIFSPEDCPNGMPELPRKGMKWLQNQLHPEFIEKRRVMLEHYIMTAWNLPQCRTCPAMERFVGLQAEADESKHTSVRRKVNQSEDKIGPFDKKTVELKDMKSYLENHGIKTAGLVEKGDFEAKVREVWHSTTGGAS